MTTLAAAFVKAQTGFAPALKNSVNGGFKSKYADLAACVEAVIDSLNSNGLALIQKPSGDDSKVTVETILIHESGEQMSFGSFSIPVSKHDAHGTMSALTYCRRGSLMAAMGIAPEDDDGNAATKAKPITPIRAAMEAVVVNEEDMVFLQGLAAELVQLVEIESSPNLAYDHMEAQKLDNDQKLALWNYLQPNSKTRSALKKEGESRRKAA